MQKDTDGDGIGDSCDVCPFDKLNDSDGDSICADLDNCPTLSNSDQIDDDNDGYGAVCDCDDTDSTINPGTIWYRDSDGDGYGNPSIFIAQCAPILGYVIDSADCNDDDSTINPLTIWYLDSDRDGFGDAGIFTVQCTQLSFFILDSTDNCTETYNPDQADTDGDGSGDACCCVGSRGDINGDNNIANVIDLTYLIDNIFRGGPGSGCPSEADLNDDGNVASILDLTYLIDFIFRGGPLPPNCQ